MPSRTRIPRLHSSTATARTSTSARRFAWWRAPPLASWCRRRRPPARRGRTRGHGPGRAPAPEPAALVRRARWRAGGSGGGLGAGIAELHAGSHASRMGKYADSSAELHVEPFSSRLGTHGPPPALPARRAASLVAETAAEFLFAATSSFGEDDNLRRAEEILACVPEPFAETRRSDGAGTDEPSGETTSGPTYAHPSPRSARSRRRPEDWRPSGWTCRRASCDERGWCSRSRAPRSRWRRARPSSSS